MEDQMFEQAARCLQVLAHPTRLKILLCLRDGAKNVQELMHLVGVRQANISQHITLMKDRGLLQSRREGNFTYYTVSNESIFELLANVKKVFCKTEK